MEQEIFSFFGGEIQWNFLENAYREKRIASSYIFLGPEHVGRETLAHRFASLFFCESESKKPCLECHHCKKIHHNEHPALFIIEGRETDVSEVRKIHDFLALKPFCAEYRFVLIRDIHLLHRHASNALLKILEEPPRNLVFLSIAENLNGILPTIQSRSQFVRLSRSSHEVMKILYKKYHSGEELPPLHFLDWVGGRPGRMIDFFRNTNTWERQEQRWKETLELFFSAKEGKLPAGKYFTDQNVAKEIFDLCEEIGRTLYFFKIHDRVPNGLPYREKISALLVGKTRESLRMFLVRISKAQKLREQNISPLLLFDQIFANF